MLHSYGNWMLHFTVTSPERKIRMMNLKSSAVEPSCWEKETVKSKAAWIYKIWTNKNKTPVRSYRRQMCLKCSLIIKSESFLTIRHFAFSLDEREILVFSINQEQKKKANSVCFLLQIWDINKLQSLHNTKPFVPENRNMLFIHVTGSESRSWAEHCI